MNQVWMYIKHGLALLLCGLFVFGAMACSDDTDKQDKNNTTDPTQCPEGERYNPVVGQCVKLPVSNNMTNNQNNPKEDMSGQDMSGDMSGDDMSTNQDMTSMDMRSDMSGQDMSGDMSSDMAGDMSMMDMSANCGYAKVKGKACAPSGAGVSGATVTIEGIDCNTGQPFSLSATTDVNGNYSFDNVPSGDHDATITSGSFNRRFTVSLAPGDDVDLTQQASKYCIETNNVKIAVIEGSFDNVEGILQQLQLTFEVKGNDAPMGGQDRLSEAVTFLRDLNAMKQYDIIFINCGLLWGKIDRDFKQHQLTILTNIRDYVISGGSLYASDLAHPFIERSLPNLFDFLGNDMTVTDAWDGYAPQIIQANVVDTRLQAALGKSTVEIDFPQDPANGVFSNNWSMVEGVGGAGKILVSGNAQRCAAGTFGNACPGIDGTLMNAPLLVTYKDSGNGGAAVFTSFHNERQVAVGQDVLNILKFLIFQL